MFGKGKKKKEVLMWEREEEYQRAKGRCEGAEIAWINAKGKENEDQLKVEWLEAKEVYEMLYKQKMEWMRATNSLPDQGKEKISKDTWVAAILTTLGIVAPPLIENRGVIMAHAKSWVQKPKLWRK